jgi:hypothetical protein
MLLILTVFVDVYRIDNNWYLVLIASIYRD